MILESIKLYNFRQFRGEQSLIFATPSEGANVTVVHGENGRGKTGIYRALLFCLFGDLKLAQDEGTESSEIKLVNTTALQEAGQGKPIEAYVEAGFTHKQEAYTLKRTLRGMLKGGRALEELGDCQLFRIQRDGNTEALRDEVAIQQRISDILNPGVKDYFLFDGEKMERLTRAGREQKREVARGIRSLLDIDALEIASNASDKVVKRFTQELQATSSADYAQVMQDLLKLDEEITDLRARLGALDAELGMADEEIRRIDEHLEEFKEIKEDIERRKQLESQLSQREADITDLLSKIRSFIPRASFLLVSDTLRGVFNHIDDQRSRGELPAEIRKDLIDRILRDNECICGRSLVDSEEALRRIVAWRERTTDETLEDTALQLWRHLSSLTIHVGEYESDAASYLKLYGNTRNEIGQLHRELEEVSDRIAESGVSERKDAHALEEQRRGLLIKKGRMEGDQATLGVDIQSKESLRLKLNQKRSEEEAKLARKDDLALRAQLARDVKDALSEVVKRFTADIKVDLGQMATHYLDLLLDTVGKESIKRIVVQQDYSLEVLDRYDQSWLANISAGQRQVMSIAFIVALAEAASGAKGKLEMPLFMDTPFGRLDPKHRSTLIRQLPALAAQWVLLATGSEFTEAAAQTLADGGAWGKFYLLVPQPDGSTQIQERPPSVSAYRGIVGDLTA